MRLGRDFSKKKNIKNHVLKFSEVFQTMQNLKNKKDMNISFFQA